MRVSSFGVLIIFLIAAAGCTVRPVADTHDAAVLPVAIEGTYTVVGDGYGGTAIIRQQGDVYVLQWQLLGQRYTGIGLRDGEQLSAAWFGGSGEKGVVVYRIEPGPRLTGAYASLPGNGLIRKEVLRFKAPLETPAAGRTVL